MPAPDRACSITSDWELVRYRTAISLSGTPLERSRLTCSTTAAASATSSS